MEAAIVDDVARMLADKCRAAANDPLAPSSRAAAKGFGAGSTSGRGAEEEQGEQGGQELLLLRDVAARQAEASAESHVEASAMWDMAREYEREAARLAELLERAGLPPALLTPRARLLSAVAARVADALGAAAATPEHALACWAELAVRESRAAALKASADARAAEMRAEAAPVEARGAALAEALRSARDAAAGHGGGGGGRRRAELEARSVQEMAAKRSEYERVVARCERKIGAALAATAAAAAAAADAQAEQQQQQREQQPQPTMLLRHAELQRRAERLAAKRGELREAERRAAEFLDLPASVAGARAALEQARERLARSQERLELGLAQL